MSPSTLPIWIALGLLIAWLILRARAGRADPPYGAFPSRPAEASGDAASPEGLARQGRTLDAIKALRARLPGLGLQEAREMVEHFAAHGRWPEGLAGHSTPPPSPGAGLESLIRSGDMIEAIRMYREQHPGLGLKEARDAVLAMAERLQA